MDPALEIRLQQALGDAYTLDRELAPGGMSRLFLATERALERQVVVKVLPPDVASEVGAERFRREMLVAARLQHPHILPVLNAGARDGLLFYVMPWVPGESLRARLVREQRLPVPDALRILRELADALVCAHEAGVVHRDLKPENVLFQRDHAVLADFGVARATDANLGPRLTSTGLGLGTLGYMAPEQLGGQPDVDARADLYALGAIAYEMLSGTPPFMGATPAHLMALHLTERPRPVGERQPDVPPALTALVGRLLEKEPTARPGSANEVLQALGAIATPTRTIRARAESAPKPPRGSAHDLLFATILAHVKWTDEQVAWIKSVFVPRTLKKGQIYERAGEVTRRGGFVTRGLFRTYAIDASGNERIIRFSPEGAWVGNLQSATTGTPTDYFVDAIEPSDVLVVDMPSFERLLELDPEQGRSFRMGLQRSREAMERRLALYATASAEERYADFLARQPALARRVPQRMLASYLGITPETLSRVRRKLKDG